MRRRLALAAAAVVAAGGAWLGVRLADPTEAATWRRTEMLVEPGLIPGSDLGVPGMFAGLLWLRLTNDFGAWAYTGQLDDERVDYLARTTRRIVRLEPYMADPALFSVDVLASRGGQAEYTYGTLLHALAGQSGRWEIYFRLGYVAYRHFGLPMMASEWWVLTGGLPGRPDYLPVLAAMIRLKRTGELDEALGRLSVEAVRQPELRQELVEVEDFRSMARRLKADLRTYAERTGRPAATPEELVAAGIWREVPLDPWGAPIRIEGGRILPGDRLPLHLRVWEDQVQPTRSTLRGDALVGWAPVL